MSHRLEDDEQERKLFVGGLNKTSTDEEDVKRYFEQYGSVVDVTILRDQDRVSRGFGFVLFDDAASVDKVITAKKDGTEFILDEKSVQVKRALPKVPGGKAFVSRPNESIYRKVFVGGLPSSITEEELRQYFENYGRVNEVELLRDRETNRLRGFAFITFDDEDSADKCIQRRSHEICKKMCEVKRAHNRSNLDREGDQGRRSGGSGNRESQPKAFGGSAPPASGGMSRDEVNQLIQQAFAMGQQSAQPALSAPTAGVGAGAALTSNVLLQALMGQQPAAAPPAPVAPVAPPPAPAPAAPSASLMQLAQLLQTSGVNATALGSLLKGGAPPAEEKPSAGYTSTAYPPVSSYDYGYSNKNSDYGYSKDDGKRRYNPY